MNRFVAVIVLMLSFAGSVSAQWYQSRDTYWYYGNGSQPYTRQLVQAPSYWQCGVYYPGASSYTYTRYHAPAAYVAPVAKAVDWRTQLLEIAAKRDDHFQYMEAVGKLGLDRTPYGAPYLPQGLPNVGYGSTVQGHYYSYPYPVNATTQYGLSQQSYNDRAQAYYNFNPEVALQMSDQHVLQALKLGGQGMTGFREIIAQDGQNRARIAEHFAKAAIVKSVLDGLKAGPEVKGFSFKIDSGGNVQRVEENVPPAAKQQLANEFAQLVSSRCASCHTGKEAKGQFDIASYPGLTTEQKQIVWMRLDTADDKQVMPQPRAGEAVQRLTPREKRLFYLN